MDRNENDPGQVERQMDEAPAQRDEADRDTLQGGWGAVEREGTQGGGAVERESPEPGTTDERMGAGQREGGYGYDRPVETRPARDMDPDERSADRDGMHGSPREPTGDRTPGDQGRETTGEGIARDW